MSGLYTFGVSQPTTAALTWPLTGAETMPMDTNLANGSGPETLGPTTKQLFGVGTPTSITSTGTAYATNGLLAKNFSVRPNTTTVTLSNPTNLQPGSNYRWIITRGGTKVPKLAYGNLFTFAGASTGTTAATTTTVDIITAFYDGTKLRAQMVKNYA